MKKINALLLIVLVSFCIRLSAQNASFQLLKTIETTADFFTTDNQSNIYVVKANELTKFDKTGKLLYKYSNNNFGNITFVDASNMLKILVFYKNYLQVVFLDNTLSQNGDPINFDKLGFIQAQLICSSHNNGMWIYDQQNMELVRIDQNLERTQQTGNLSVLLAIPMKPDFLIEYDNKVYLNNPGTGILVFDIYGTYYKTIPVKNVKQFQPFGSLVYYNDGNEIKAYNLKTADETQFETPLTEFKKFRLEVGILTLQTKDSIQLYTPAQ
jgi:hypothetical protein